MYFWFYLIFTAYVLSSLYGIRFIYSLRHTFWQYEYTTVASKPIECNVIRVSTPDVMTKQRAEFQSHYLLQGHHMYVITPRGRHLTSVPCWCDIAYVHCNSVMVSDANGDINLMA